MPTVDQPDVVVRVVDKRSKVRRETDPVGWDAAIEECLYQIQQNKNRINVLERCVRTFERFKSEGVVFPGERPVE